MENLKHNLSDSDMTDLASHMDNEKGNTNKTDDNDNNASSSVYMDDPGLSSSSPPAKIDLEVLERVKPLDEVHEALIPNLEVEMDCQGIAASPVNNSPVIVEDDSEGKEVNKILTSV